MFIDECLTLVDVRITLPSLSRGVRLFGVIHTYVLGTTPS
jgi:hypothetical protein